MGTHGPRNESQQMTSTTPCVSPPCDGRVVVDDDTVGNGPQTGRCDACGLMYARTEPSMWTTIQGPVIVTHRVENGRKRLTARCDSVLLDIPGTFLMVPGSGHVLAHLVAIVPAEQAP